MTTVEDIKEAIEKLDSVAFDRLRDEKIARDAESGKLDRLADHAIADFHKRRR
jgi:hypothetical protein